MNTTQRNQINSMVIQIEGDVAKHYYDPNLHGIDWKAKMQETKEKIKNEKSFNMAMSHLAAALDSLNDSHTFLIPPRRNYVLDHGWTLQMIGDKCMVTRLRPSGDAATHGVKPGDQVLAINGYRVTRDNLWKIEYAFNVLRPLPQLTVTLQDSGGQVRKAGLQAVFRERAKVRNLDMETVQNIMVDEEEDWNRETRIRAAEFGDLLVIRLNSFMFEPGEVGHLISMARNHKALVLDLRQNPGGDVDTVKALIGGLFNHDVKIADRVTRKGSKPWTAKADRSSFDGKLIVLVDSQSASGSEILARVVQLEKRGIVVGDRSAGAVMEAEGHEYSAGIDMVTFYGASITDADLIMTDGKSLEHAGVMPDEKVLPTAEDIGAGRDPVLAHAAELAGVKVTPEQAGKLFPYEWPKDK